MNNFARKSFLRHFEQLKWQKKLLSSAVLKENDFIIKSSLPDIVIPEMRFLDRLWKESDRFQNHVALECAETKKNYTYAQLQKNIAVFATSLIKKLNLNQGDVVSAMMPNRPEFVVVAFGTLQAGCVLSTINPIYKEYEVTHQLSLVQPKVIVTIPECYDVIQNGMKNAKINVKIIIIDNAVPNGVIKFSEVGENGDADYALIDKIERNKEDVAVIPFSSGTTGLPKGVELTHRNLLAGLEIMQDEHYAYPKFADGSFQDVVPCVLPFFHIYGLVVTLIGHLSKGCKLVTIPKFSASLYFDVLKEQKASILYVVPPLAMLLAKHPDVTGEHLQNVRFVVCGAAPISSSDVEPLMEKSKGKLQFAQGYGATETTSLATTTFIGAETNHDDCGQPMASVEIKFVDPITGDPVPVGQSGELYVRGPNVMKGYHKNEKETKNSLTEDGFFKTGDLGHFDPNTGLYLTDRIKELIKVKGMQVAPAELEGLLRSHPAVQDAAVIGVPHELYGEAPKAFIVPKEGQKTSSEELKHFIAGKVAAFKKIEEVAFVDTIPKNASGKILRTELKKLYA